MPRGMDERFDDLDEDDEGDGEAPSENSSESASESDTTSRTSRTESQPSSEASGSSVDGGSDESLNIREDWDTATIYVEPNLSEEMEIAFTRLKKQLKRDGHILRKNEHFYRAIFEIAFEDHPEQTKERIRELARQDSDNQ